MLRWSLEACANKVWPLCDPLGAKWIGTEGTHFANAGLLLGARACLVQVKGDWAEYAHTFGFPTWSSALFPCPFCKCTREQLFVALGLSPLSFPNGIVDQNDYDLACSACEIWVTIKTKAQQCLVAGTLRYDKRKGPSNGRALQQDIPELGLCAYDRLEPHSGLWDVAKFEALPLPAKVLFWRAKQETRTKHRCPLFSAALGVTVLILVIDVLHALNLGVYQQYLTDAIWAFIRADAWGVGAALSQDERLQMSAQRLKNDLWEYYAEVARKHPGVHVHQLQDLTWEMLGTWAKPKLKLKAAEGKTTMFFVVALAERFAASVPEGHRILEAGRCLTGMQRVFDDGDAVLTPQEIQDKRIGVKRFNVQVCHRNVWCNGFLCRGGFMCLRSRWVVLARRLQTLVPFGGSTKKKCACMSSPANPAPRFAGHVSPNRAVVGSALAKARMHLRAPAFMLSVSHRRFRRFATMSKDSLL